MNLEKPTWAGIFGGIGGMNVLVQDDPQEVFNELTLRSSPICELNLLPNGEEASALAFQRYHCYFNGFNNSANDRAMALPVSGTFTACPRQIEDQENTNMPMLGFNSSVVSYNNFNGIWAFSCTKGFGTKSDLSNLIYTMLQYVDCYPSAYWYPDYTQAEYSARINYNFRFYQRYNAQQESIILPPYPVPLDKIFIDPRYDEREENRRETPILQKFLESGLLNQNYIWRN